MCSFSFHVSSFCINSLYFRAFNRRKVTGRSSLRQCLKRFVHSMLNLNFAWLKEQKFMYVMLGCRCVSIVNVVFYAAGLLRPKQRGRTMSFYWDQGDRQSCDSIIHFWRLYACEDRCGKGASDSFRAAFLSISRWRKQILEKSAEEYEGTFILRLTSL
jgi:hypothetical protein